MRFFMFAFLLVSSSVFAAEPPAGLDKIRHIVVIYLENHGFDNLYGLFPGANGLTAAALPQTDLAGKPYAVLPPAIDTGHKPAQADARFPADLPNQPFPIDRYVAPDQKTGDLVHRFYQNQAQINGGRNDRFAAVSDAGGLAMGYYDGHSLPLWQYAAKYTLADNFFQGAFGGSFLNHFWLVCACTPRHDNAPAEITAVLDVQGKLVKDGAVTPDGYAVNTLQPTTMPIKAGTTPSKQLPAQTMPTIGDRLSEKGITWAWYSGGWNDAIAGHPDQNFQFHHQPFGYFSRYTAGSKERALHLKDETEFLKAIDDGQLPAVAFYKPIGELNEHPGYADVMAGERHIAELLARIEHSPQWQDTAVIVTYDENGGFWDHVAPPVKDRWGPGTRIPTLVVSPFARRGYVDHTEYDTTSILKFIETRFGLEPLGERDAKASDLTGAFAFK
ncbi:MAG TPA: alkaline phosphatase family protein [Novimethylophilus sp.]|jgi:phospholipase C|uniref:alkaline phosphatase family protein n=1 Tax=Novimethylophilus sp. TaxID=2137426 RepID=UPI002F3E5C63